MKLILLSKYTKKYTKIHHIERIQFQQTGHSAEQGFMDTRKYWIYYCLIGQQLFPQKIEFNPELDELNIYEEDD